MKFNDVFNFSSSSQDDEHWVSVSDLMAGLMVIFLFIAVTYIRPLAQDRATIYDKLQEEFKDDFKKWNAELVKDTLSIRFKEPNVLFDAGRSTLKKEFKSILDDFSPRYAKVLYEFKDSIEEVRIEGHTSSEWTSRTSEDGAYFNNMALSQDRTREVLKYALSLDGMTPYKDWAKAHITANGLSSSQLIKTEGKENPKLSRRVEFRVRTKPKGTVIRAIKP